MDVFYVKHGNVNENWEENSGCGIPFLAGGGYQNAVRNAWSLISQHWNCVAAFVPVLFIKVCDV